MGMRKKKMKAGEATEYWSRTTAMKKLQLTLKDFRRLCILKGIYPREPRNRKKAQRGDTTIKTLYHKKDIQFLMHEPIIWKIREQRTHGRKISRAQSLREFREMKRLLNNYPQMSLDHLVKERYPTFVSALRDLDDCLTMCFLYASFPLVNPLPREQPLLCRRLSYEFLHACIAGQYLRKCFVSIKGYYFQAEIKGQTITWIMPHHFCFKPTTKDEVDFKIMSTFTSFYLVLLGFVNYRLFHSLNLSYPPQVTFKDVEADSELMDREDSASERIAALNIPLQKANANQPVEEEECEIDSFNTGESEESLARAREEAAKLGQLKVLFKGLKVFVSREVPRDAVVFALRSCQAEVSWDATLAVGATFPETDETITHHIVDRPHHALAKQYISRYYVQPQWVFDCVNARELLPVERYFVGVRLPPHLSPFVETHDKSHDYVPPEQVVLETNANTNDESITSLLATTKRRKRNRERKKNEDEDGEEEEEKGEKEGDEGEGKIEELTGKNQDENREEKAEKLREEKKKKMGVKEGEVLRENPLEERSMARQELKLREKMIPRKYRNLYNSMLKAQSDKRRDRNVLMRKRIKIEKQKEKKKEASDQQ